jgi:RNA polymerase sigma-70 factor (ECF subfamily)
MDSVPLTSEKELFDRIRSGDQGALKELYYAHFGNLTRVAYRITGDTAHAEDVAQQSFIILWTKRKQVDIQTDLYAYLRKITVNTALADNRKDARRDAIRAELPPTSTKQYNAEDRLTEKELKRDIDLAVEDLPRQCRAIFKLSRYEELTYKEIAETLDISPKTVENHMGKALKLLRQSLRQYLHSLLF